MSIWLVEWRARVREREPLVAKAAAAILLIYYTVVWLLVVGTMCQQWFFWSQSCRNTSQFRQAAPDAFEIYYTDKTTMTDALEIQITPWTHCNCQVTTFDAKREKKKQALSLSSNRAIPVGYPYGPAGKHNLPTFADNRFGCYTMIVQRQVFWYRTVESCSRIYEFWFPLGASDMRSLTYIHTHKHRHTQATVWQVGRNALNGNYNNSSLSG